MGKERQRTERANFETVAQAYLELLSLRGVEYFFANSGTDFASIVDAFVLRDIQGKTRPRPVTVPHEIPLVAMAHGYYLVTGRPQVGMVHVGVGTANGLGGIMAAHRARVPILFSAGRTPVTEEGHPASRAGHIHWGQECFDQAGMLREFVKWDYELRSPSQLEAVVDRAFSMAMMEPKGPVYLMLPREILTVPLEDMQFRIELPYDLPVPHPDPSKIEEAADLLTKARFPLIITTAVGRSPAAVQALVDLAETGAMGVISFNPEYMNFPLNHFCHQGFNPFRLLSKADVILVLDCPVPWFPNREKPQESAVIIQSGIDPLYSRYPIRSFPSDLTLLGDSCQVLPAIAQALLRHPDKEDEALTARREARRDQLRSFHQEMIRAFQAKVMETAGSRPLEPFWISSRVNRIIQEETIVVSEQLDYAFKEQLNDCPGRYFANPHAGYLGWSIGAALGVKLACPERTIINLVGDGSYMFAVPTACHFVSNAYHLPILIIIYNNQSWNAVKRATLNLHPEGWAARANQFPLSELQPSPRYEKICEAFGGYGERVESPDQVAPALERALYAVRHEKRQAVLNMVCRHP